MLALLAWGWGIDLESLASRETTMTRIAHGALSAVAIALIADFIWHALAKAAIDIKLAETADLGLPNTPEARRRARVHTLLPIFRNILFVVVAAAAGLMALAAMGVEIGPLIAALSVLGVAIGFGAQTFVRDIIAGMFTCSTTPSGSASTSRAAITRVLSRASAFARSGCAINAVQCSRCRLACWARLKT